MNRHCVCSKNTIFSYLAQDPYIILPCIIIYYYHNKIFSQNSFFFAGVKGGPLYDTTRAWFNLLRFIVGNMKNGYVDEGGFIFADLSSDKSDTEEIDDENGASLHERLVTPERVR